MTILFEMIKIIFFLLTVMMIFILVKGKEIFSEEMVYTVHTILTPAYLVFLGILLAYILVLTLNNPKNTHQQNHSLHIKMFLGGLFIGSIFALLYIFA